MLLRKDVYPYEYVDSWERFDEISLPHKKAFYSELYLQDITNEDYRHAQKVLKELKLKRLGDYYYLYVQSGTLLLIEQMYLKTLETNVLKYINSILLIFFSTWISMTSLFKKDKSKIRIIN